MGGLYPLTDANGYIPNSSEAYNREIIKKLKDDGWVLPYVRGNHHQFKHPIKSGKVTVPHPNRKIGLLAQ